MATVHCTKCNAAIAAPQYNRGQMSACPACGSKIMAAVFPALLQAAPPPRRGEWVVDGAESSCFYHPRKRAAAICDLCGRFLCSLCDVQAGSSHHCPNCLGRAQNASGEVLTRRATFDTLAVVLAVIPLGITPLISLYLAIRHWADPPPLVSHGRIRWCLAILLVAAQILAWTLLFTGRWP